MIWAPVIMYLLGMILVLGITEATDEDNPNAPLKLAVFWPLVAVSIAFHMVMASING